ncbi:hypothetical protein EBB07_32425 [Paenibacillaceae bacterium]|nr:hypothetical protein EBB07_32425 [Paenibacillaceae bacterium]
MYADGTSLRPVDEEGGPKMRAPNRSGGVWKVALFTALFMTFLLYIPSPYVVYEPGLVEPVTEMVQVAESDDPGSGQFMLTTVKMTYANFFMTFRSLWDSDVMLLNKKDVLGGRSEGEYVERLVYVMQNSQSNAIEAAYRIVHIPYSVEPQQLVVIDVNDKRDSPFRAGDALISVNGTRFKDAIELVDILNKSKTGERLKWTIQRGGQITRVDTSLKQQPADPDGGDLPQAMGGVVLAEISKVVPRDSENSVTITAGEIGGPSAGLIFALQTIDYLTPGDLTHGIRIAGTGTITPDGKVGPIGGIALKVRAADRTGAQLFLAPRENYEEARRKAAAIGSAMRVEPIGTLAEALEVLTAADGEAAA